MIAAFLNLRYQTDGSVYSSIHLLYHVGNTVGRHADSARCHMYHTLTRYSLGMFGQGCHPLRGMVPLACDRSHHPMGLTFLLHSGVGLSPTVFCVPHSDSVKNISCIITSIISLIIIWLMAHRTEYVPKYQACVIGG